MRRTITRGLLLIAFACELGSEYVAAQRMACTAIRPGDTAAAAAARITGDSRNVYGARFQIIDPAAGAIVPKSAYDRIHAGWHACVVDAPAVPRDATPLVLLGVIVIASAVLWTSFEEYLRRRQTTIDAMTRFGEQFVREFERPLLQPPRDSHPIRSRVIARPDSRRLDILLAPGDRRRYPNLVDHKDNVTYDINRVLHIVRDQSFVCAPPHAEGGWVVIPFQFHDGWKEEGGS